MICQLLAAMRRALASQREGLDLIAFIDRRSTQPRRGRLSPTSLRARGVTSQGRTDIAAQSSARHL
jgi:hypothetical protein